MEAIREAYFENGLLPDIEELSLPKGSSQKSMQVMKVDGRWVLRNDFVHVFERQSGETSAHPVLPEDLNEKMLQRRESLATNIWFLSLGFSGLHGIVPESQMGANRSTFRIHSKVVPIKENAYDLVHEISMVAGIALGEPGAVSVIKNACIPRRRRIE